MLETPFNFKQQAVQNAWFLYEICIFNTKVKLNKTSHIFIILTNLCNETYSSPYQQRKIELEYHTKVITNIASSPEVGH